MRTETQMTIAAAWWRMSGIVDAVAPAPTNADILMSSPPSMFATAEAVKSGKYRTEAIGRFGAVHGQKVSGRAVLNFDFWSKKGVPVKKNDVYALEWTCVDSVECMWVVSSMQFLETDPDFQNSVLGFK